MVGSVHEYDDAKGYGTITAEDGRQIFFQCTRIADGSRSIDEGAPVVFEIVPGHHGRWEAAAIVKL
jgi:cold shock CspA family protein